MRASLLLLGLGTLAVLACVVDSGAAPDDLWNDDDDWWDEPPADDDDDDDATAGPSPVLLYPEEGATDVPPTAGVWVDFDGENPAGSLSLTRSDGAEVSGRSAAVGPLRLLFAPDGLLEPETSYTAELSTADLEQSWTFTTSDLGSTPTGADPSGRTFQWELASGRVGAPPGGELFVAGAGLRLLLEIQEADDEGLDVIGALALGESDEAAQDPCAATFELSTGDGGEWQDPRFGLGPTTFRQTLDLSIVSLGLVEIPFRDVRFDGNFVGDATEGITGITDGRLSATVDGREVGIPDACGTLSSLGLSCAPCPEDPEAQACLVFWIQEVEGEAVDLDLQERSLEEILADPSCS